MNAVGMVVSSYLIEVEKMTMVQTEEWRQLYPVAFEKEYSRFVGLGFKSRPVKV
jgi:hypothetical protein